jgi:hypothetical protein
MSQTPDEKADSDEMSSSNTPAASSAVERFLTLLKRNLLKEVEEENARQAREPRQHYLLEDLRNRKN